VRGCYGTAEGPRRVVLPCAGAYVSGPVNSNQCPAGSARIAAEAACRTAVAAAGKTTGTPFVVSVSAEPRGCNYFTRSNIAYFNADPVGAGNPNAQLLCSAGADAGAPPVPMPMAAARVHRQCAAALPHVCRARPCAIRAARLACVCGL
jgi:hypothetical protein